MAPITSGPAAISSSGMRKKRCGASCAGHRFGRRRMRVRSAKRALETLLEALDLAGGVDDVLRAGEEGVALVAHLDLDRLGGRPDGEGVAAPDAANLRLVERWMDLGLHGNRCSVRQAVADWPMLDWSSASMLTRFLLRVSWVNRTRPSAVAKSV